MTARTFALFLGVAVAAMLAGTPCAGLRSLKLDGATITAAEAVAEGPYPLPGQPAAAPPPAPLLPAHCRVAAVLAPSPDSHIGMELWMPAAEWNGKFEAVGGGGWAGSISYSSMATALQERYATASTDTGHTGGNADFALGHPEKMVDFGYRAVHEMTVKSKAIVEAYYGRSARLSYFSGCSTGGRQALVEAERYPLDFDGIVAGAPANPHIRLHAAALARFIGILKIPGEHAFSPAKQNLLAKAVLNACDALDGVKDGLLTDPRACRFDPASLRCKGDDPDTCLTAPQVEAVKKMYADIQTENGEMVWTGFERGGESGWASLGSRASAPAPLALDTFRIVAHQDPNWDWHNFDLNRDLALAVGKAGFIDVTSADLSAFRAHGGKLLLYHGWSDPGIAPGNTLNYYSRLLATMGPRQDDWLKLYMVPGMQHCGGGPGPNQFGMVPALERWRESGAAPERIVAYHVTGSRVDMTRPLCPYPQVAKYNGSGSTNDAANFTCQAP
jgi:feruloyl esterase